MTSHATVAAAGLTEAEAAAARARGEGNMTTRSPSRSYAAILRTNLFTFFNNVLFGIGVALIALDRPNDALVSVGLGLINALLSSLQEVRAKRKLDRLKLLHRGTTRVVRDGAERDVPPHELVRGDLIHVRAGDQIAVDGPVEGEGRLEIDESLLTGESEPIVKRHGDLLSSGSSCLAGDGWQRAAVVGAASHAQTVTALARGWTVERTPLQRHIDRIVRAVMLTAALLSCLVLAQSALAGRPVLQMVQDAAVLSGLIPYGLFLLVAVAYSTAAAQVARRGALIQQVNAVEALSNVDVLCTDKTGTLTTGKLQLETLENLGDSRTLGSIARSFSAGNATTAALVDALPGDRLPVRQEVPFSSRRGWSGLALAGSAESYVLGAFERLAPMLPDPEALRPAIAAWTGRGYRVLVFATTRDPGADLFDIAGTPYLPELAPAALVVLRDELRPHVRDTLDELAAAGVQVKVISGDDPATVAALAAQVGLPASTPVSGSDLKAMAGETFDRTVLTTQVFGRIAPEQKRDILDALRRQGHYTAMIGDGVNDIPSLKRANVGVAMQSGSAVTRDIADIVLLGDSFAALSVARERGQRVIAGISTTLPLFLARVATSTLIIIAIAILGLGFPYEPAQVSLTLFTVGLPTFFLVRWAAPEPFDPAPGRRLVSFVGPAALVTAAYAVALYAVQYRLVEIGIGRQLIPAEVVDRFSTFTGVSGTDATFTQAAATISAQTMLSTFTAISAFGLILFLAPPLPFFAVWTARTTDRRPTLLAAALLVIFLVVLCTPPAAAYFGLLTPSRALGGPLMLIALPAWLFTLRAVWRHRLLPRALGLA